MKNPRYDDCTKCKFARICSRWSEYRTDCPYYQYLASDKEQTTYFEICIPEVLEDKISDAVDKIIEDYGKQKDQI